MDSQYGEYPGHSGGDDDGGGSGGGGYTPPPPPPTPAQKQATFNASVALHPSQPQPYIQPSKPELFSKNNDIQTKVVNPSQNEATMRNQVQFSREMKLDGQYKLTLQGTGRISSKIGKTGNITTIAQGMSEGFGMTDVAKTMNRTNTVLNILQTGADIVEQAQKQQPVWKGAAKVSGHLAINVGTGFMVGTLAFAHGAAYVATFGPEAPLTYPVITVSGVGSIYSTIKAGDKVQSAFDDWIDNK